MYVGELQQPIDHRNAAADRRKIKLHQILRNLIQRKQYDDDDEFEQDGILRLV